MASTKKKRKTMSRGSYVRVRGLMDRVGVVEKPLLRADFPIFKSGDTVRVHVRIKEGEKERIQIFEGVVIARGNRGASRSFTVRKISHGVGVERIFQEASPKVAKVELAQEGRVRRAKLYYLRKLEGKAARIEREIDTQVTASEGSASAKKPA